MEDERTTDANKAWQGDADVVSGTLTSDGRRRRPLVLMTSFTQLQLSLLSVNLVQLLLSQ